MPEEKEDSEEQEAKDGESPDKPKKNRGPLKLLLAVMTLVSLGVIGAVFAIPKKAAPKAFKGPFHAVVSDSKIAVNLRDNAGKRYLQINGEVLYFAYDASYMNQRQDDPFYKSMLINAINRISSDKYMDDVHSGARREQFIEELREGIEPIAFPVHIGNTTLPYDRDEESGLRPGISADRGTFRGRFYDHELILDAVAKTLQLDEGPQVHFSGGEENLEVYGTNGKVFYVDVSSIEEAFQGSVNVGVHGTIRRFIETEYVFQ